MQRLIVILLGFFICGCAVDENVNSSPVRQRFKPIDSEVSGRGANWTAMVPAPLRYAFLKTGRLRVKYSHNNWTKNRGRSTAIFIKPTFPTAEISQFDYRMYF